MNYIKSIIPWLFQNNDEQAFDAAIDLPDGKMYGNRLFYGILSVIFLFLAFLFYSGTNFRLLGPPFGGIGGQDFRQILRASREILERENIYQHAIPYAESPNFAEFKMWSAAPYPYSPIVAVLAMPFTVFDEDAVLAFWTVVSWLLLIASSVLIVIGILKEKNFFKLLAVLLFFCMYGPVHLNLTLVQLDILILFLLSLTFFLYQKQSIYAGIILGLAISLKLLVAPLVVYFLWKKDWKTSAVAFATFGLLTMIGFSVAGWRLLGDFIKVNYLWNVTAMLSYPFNQSLNGIGIRLFTHNAYIEPLFVFPPLVALLRVLGSLTVIVLWLKSVTHQDNRATVAGFLEYGLTLSTMLFLSPLVDDIHYVWLLLPLGALLALVSKSISIRKRSVLSLFTVLSALFLADPDLHDAIYHGWENLMYHNALVSQKYAILTGAYLYGLIFLELILVLTIKFFRQKEFMSKEILVGQQ